MNKIIKIIIAVSTIALSQASALSQTSAGFFADTVSKEDMKNMFVCEKTKTGIAKFSFGILETTSILRGSGVKTVVLKSGNELTMNIGGLQKITIEFKKIDESALKNNNAICYEAQSVEADNEELTREDETLNINTLSALGLFGYLLPTEKDKQLAQEKRAKDNAMEIFSEQQKLEKAKAEKLEKDAIKEAEQQKLAQIEKNKKQAERIAKKKMRDALSEKRNKYLSMIDEFEKKSKIHTLKDNSNKNLILTNETLDDLVVLLDNLEAEIPNVMSSFNSDLRKIRGNIDRLYAYYDDSQRISQQSHFYDGGSSYYSALISRIKQRIKKIKLEENE